ncbi:MAG: energy-coupling factor transporter transmembrane component T family protein [Nitrososphaeria archaeon]
MSFIISGIYETFIHRPVNSIIYRRSPFVRPIFPVIAALISVIVNNVPVALIIFASMMAFAAIAKTMHREIIIMRSAFIFSTMLFALALLADGLGAAFVSMLKFIDVMASISLISAVISIEELEVMGRLVHLPRSATFVFAMTVKFIPVMLMDLQEIVHSLASHGVELNFKNPIKLVKALAPMMIAMVMIAIRRSEELADAMTVRGYGMSDKPTLLYRFTVTKKDMIFMMISVIAGSIIVYAALSPGIFIIAGLICKRLFSTL